MRVRIVTLTRYSFIINVHPAASIDELKARVTQETGIPLVGQRLVYKGEELVEGTIEDFGITEDDFLVVIVVEQRRPPPNPEEFPRRDGVLDGDRHLHHYSDDAGSRHLDVDEEDVNDNDDEDDDDDDDDDDEGDGVDDLYEASDELQQLVDMGFRANRANKALILARGNTQLAMDWLLEHDGDPDIDEPLSLEEIDRIRSEDEDNEEMMLEQHDAMQRLMELGFTEADITYALEATGHDFEAAAAWLLGDRDFAYRMEMPDGDGGLGDVIESADDPDFQALRMGRILHMRPPDAGGGGDDDDEPGPPRQ